MSTQRLDVIYRLSTCRRTIVLRREVEDIAACGRTVNGKYCVSS